MDKKLQTYEDIVNCNFFRQSFQVKMQ